MRRIERDALEQIVAEFTHEVESIGLTAPRSRDGAIMALADHLSPPLAERLRRELASFRNGDHSPVITDLLEDTLVRLLNAESIEVGAVALSKLPAGKAAATLAKLSGERARRITFAMSKTADIHPDAVHRIGAALAHDYGTPAPRAFDTAPVQRLGAILNATKSETRADVLLGLEAEDQPFATDVRKAIFTFKDIAPPASNQPIFPTASALSITRCLSPPLLRPLRARLNSSHRPNSFSKACRNGWQGNCAKIRQSAAESKRMTPRPQWPRSPEPSAKWWNQVSSS